MSVCLGERSIEAISGSNDDETEKQPQVSFNRYSIANECECLFAIFVEDLHEIVLKDHFGAKELRSAKKSNRKPILFGYTNHN